MSYQLLFASLLLSAPTPAPGTQGPPPLAEALAKAKAAGRSLVLELSTTWCEPCKQFDAEILPAPEVVLALREVSFVQYDAEQGPGREVAATFGVSSYPTFLALDAAGVVRERQLGVTDAADFLAFLTRALAATLDEGTIKARLRAAPTDPHTQLTAARWFAAREHTADARSQYAKAATADPNGDVAPVAAWELVGLDARMRTGLALLDYAARFPRSHRAPAAISFGALAGHGSPEKVRAALSAYVAANRDDVDRLHDTVTVALAAGLVDSAHHAAQRLVELEPSNPDAYDLLAEVYHQRGEKERALQGADRALALAGDDRERLVSNRARFARGAGEASPELQAARRAAQEFYATITDPVFEPELAGGPPPDIEALMHFETEARSALMGAGAACAAAAGKLAEAWVRVELPDQPGRPKKVAVLEPGVSPKLRACLVRDLSARRFPAAPPQQGGQVIGGGAAPLGRYTAAVPFGLPAE